MNGTILVTGGTGTLGRELVRRLAVESSTPRVVVLSRSARDPDPGFPSGIRVVQGDLLAGPGMGLSASVREELSADVTDILHCAAETRFTLPLEEARAINVGGTRSLLEFAEGCPSLRQIGCFSTVYVAGRRTGRITEDDLEDGGSGFVNSYEQSKNEMEREIRERMGDLPIAVYRLSTLIGDSTTGAVTGFNAFHHALRLLYLGLAPMIPGDPAHRIDVVAVDHVADAACWLFGRRFEAGRTYHLCSGPERSSSLAELIDAVVEAFHRFRPEWRRRGIERPAIVDLPTYELFARSVEETRNEILLRATRAVQSFAYQLAYPKTFDRTATQAALEGSGLRPPPVLEYLPKVVRFCLENEWRTTRSWNVSSSSAA
ncbi:MAG TPA: SDR family oxidoreductase [Gemmatimonadota bacterium]|nr:SDR family oxidoreductase [Gemmatimonadota bacterium]